MKKFIEIYKKYPCFISGIAFSIIGFIFHNKALFNLAMGLFIGALLYEEKQV